MNLNAEIKKLERGFEECRAAGLSVKEFAALCGVHRTTVYDFFRRDHMPTTETFVLVAAGVKRALALKRKKTAA